MVHNLKLDLVLELHTVEHGLQEHQNANRLNVNAGNTLVLCKLESNLNWILNYWKLLTDIKPNITIIIYKGN